MLAHTGSSSHPRANAKTRVGDFGRAVQTRVRPPRRRTPENRRAKRISTDKCASELTFDAQDRLLTYGANTYAYGANGELQSKTVAGAVTSYSYDAFGNLLDVTPPTGSAIDYVIDGLNRRVGRKVGGTLVQGLLYKNQLNSVAELDGTGARVAQYVYGMKSNVPDLRVAADGTVYRVLSDHLKSRVRLYFPVSGFRTIGPSP